MKRSWRWRMRIFCLLALVLLGGCRLPATVTPEQTTLAPTAQPVAPTASAPPASSPIAATTPRPEATAAPAPTALSAPGIVATWPLDDLPAQGRYPAALTMLENTIYVANSASNNVSVVNDGRIVDVFAVGQQPSSMLADTARQRIYLASSLEPQIQVLTRTGLQSTWPMKDPVGAMHMVADVLWAADAWGQQIHIMDPIAGSELAQLALGQGQYALQMVAHPSGDTVYVRTLQAVHVVQVASRAIVESIPLDHAMCMALSPDGESLYYGAYGTEGDAYVQALSTSDMEPRQRLDLPTGISQIAVAPDSQQLALCLTNENVVWLVDANLAPRHEVLVGNRPQYAIFGPDGELYVANQDADSLTVVDAQAGSATADIALGSQVRDLAVDAVNGRVYVASANENRVLVLDPDGTRKDSWETARYPVSLATWAGTGGLAVVSQLDGELALFDQAGTLQQRFATGARPRGVMIDAFEQRIYAGGLVVDMQQGSTRSLSTKVYTELEVEPVKTLLDTRRERLYGLVYNGIPGSNGGMIIRLLDAPKESAGPDEIGWRSVRDAIYDEEQDVFYVAWSHMGSNGLVVVEAGTGRQVFALSFAEPITSMALNPAAGHLWLATGPYAWANDVQAPRTLRAFATGSLATLHEIELATNVDLMAVDSRLMRVYLVSNEAGSISVLQDMVVRGLGMLPGPPTVTPWPTSAPALAEQPTPLPPTPAATPTACPASPHPALQTAFAKIAPLGDIGCPLSPGVEIDLAWQPFEGGALIWRSDTGMIHGLLDNGPLWTVEDAWTEGMPDSSCQLAAPPADHWQPIRGFGLLWCQQSELRLALGWALAPEQGLGGIAQAFEQGTLLQLDGGETFFLGDMGAWKRLVP